MTVKIEAATDRILAWDAERGAKADVTEPKLQRLLYYAHAWHLAWSGKPLFDEPCLAFDDGPGFQSVRDRFGHVDGVLVMSRNEMQAAPGASAL